MIIIIAISIAFPILARIVVHELHMARLDYMDRIIQSRSVCQFLGI